MCQKGHIEINTKTTNFSKLVLVLIKMRTDTKTSSLMALIPLARLGEVVADVEEFTELGDALFGHSGHILLE